MTTMQNVTEANFHVVVEVDLKPNDVYTPFTWSRGNLARWTAAFVLCLIFYHLYEDSSATLLSFPSGGSILAVVALLMLLVLSGLLLFPYLRIRSLFRKSPALAKTRRYTFSADGIAVQSDDANTECKWSFFQRAVETRTTFSFSTTSLSGTYVPKRCFASHEDIQRVRSLIHENMPGKCRLRCD